jgi:flagellar operon protein
MSDPIRFPDRNIGPVLPGGNGQPAQRQGGVQGPAFEDILRRATLDRSGGLKFSGHAQTRIQSRSIPMGTEQMQRLENAVDRAAAKGARESLVMLDDSAFVVSIRNRTVITVVDKENLKDNVFTNIDSAVIG